MSFNKNELEKGINYWRFHTKWPRDFHCKFYKCLVIYNKDNSLFTNDWWHGISKKLQRWRAIRPLPLEFIEKRFFERRERLIKNWRLVDTLPQDVIVRTDMNIDTIITIIQPLIDTVYEIKNVRSPVFISKFLHFISPQKFPVIDRRAMKLPFRSYIEYWKFVRREWLETGKDLKKELIKILKNEIESEECLFEEYPFYSKIAELCLIGRVQNCNG